MLDLEKIYPANDDAALELKTQAVFTKLFGSPELESTSDAVVLPSVEVMRQGLGELLIQYRLCYPVSFEPEKYQSQKIGGLNCYVYSHERPLEVPTLVMFSGGGFCFDNREPHQAFMAHVAQSMACNIVIPDCPLAPETKAPGVIAAVNCFLSAFMKHPQLSNEIKLMGWSSGATLALGAALDLKEHREKISQLILLSPWVDLSLKYVEKGPYQKQQALDEAAGKDILKVLAQCYVGEEIMNAQFSPLLRSSDQLKVLPATTIIAGECEALIADAIYAFAQLQRAQVAIDLVVPPGLTHNYMVFDGLGGEQVAKIVAMVAQGMSLFPLSSCFVKKLDDF